MQERMGILENERMKLEQAIDREREERERLENMERRQRQDRDITSNNVSLRNTIDYQRIDQMQEQIQREREEAERRR